MAQPKNPFRNIQVELKKSPRSLKILLAVLILLCTVTLAALGMVTAQIRSHTQDLKDQAAALEQDNADLQDKIDLVGSVEGIQQIAQDELGLADPDTVIIRPTGP